jgi:hypothetical protein
MYKFLNKCLTLEGGIIRELRSLKKLKNNFLYNLLVYTPNTNTY